MVCKSFLSNVFLFFFVNYFIFEFLFFFLVMMIYTMCTIEQRVVQFEMRKEALVIYFMIHLPTCICVSHSLI